MIRRILAQALPYAAAFAVPFLVVTGLYLLAEVRPLAAMVGGAVGGGLGVLGALCSTLVRSVQDRRTLENEIEDLVVVIKEPLPPAPAPLHGGHEGLARLHQDVANDDHFRNEER
jgi:hypothetical protein